MTALVAVETVVLALVVVLLTGLLRSHATILRRLHELGAGVDADGIGSQANRPRIPGPARGRPASGPAHDLGGLDRSDGAVALRVAGAAHDTLLVFLSSGCSTCQVWWEALSDPDLALPTSTRLVVVTRDKAEELPSLLAEVLPPRVHLVQSTQAWLDYGVPGSPYAVLVDGPAGRVQGEGTAATFAQVLSLLARSADDAVAIDAELLAAGIRPGDPSLHLPPDLTGVASGAGAGQSSEASSSAAGRGA